MLTLEQLITPVSEDDALASMLEILTQLGFNATTWQEGASQLTFLRFFARVYSKLTDTVAAAAAGGFTTLATTNFLRLLALHIYDIQYIPAQPTIGKFLLTSSAAAPVHTFVAGDIIVADVEDGEGNSYTCTEGGTLNPGSTLSIEFKADVAGSAANIAPDTPLFLWTPLAGVTVTCPALLPESNTWITTPGEDDESDARLMERCKLKWARLTYGNIEGAYRGWALEALPALTRVAVKAAAGDANVVIVGATALGGLTGGQITTITDYVNGTSDGIGRRPINDIVTTESAVVRTTPALTVTAYVLPSEESATDARIQTALLDYFGALPIGGSKLVSDTTGYIIESEVKRLCKTAGVKKITLSITDDITLAYNEIYVPAITVNTVLVQPGAL